MDVREVSNDRLEVNWEYRYDYQDSEIEYKVKWGTNLEEYDITQVCCISIVSKYICVYFFTTLVNKLKKY